MTDFYQLSTKPYSVVSVDGVVSVVSVVSVHGVMR
jgi:hypothetical protein